MVYTGASPNWDIFELAAQTGAETVSNFRINGTPLVEVVELFRAEEVEILDRGNFRTEVQFDVCRTHATYEDAEAYILDHAASIPCVGRVVFMSKSGKMGLAKLRWLENAAVSSIQVPRYVGISTFHSYTIIGGKMRKS